MQLKRCFDLCDSVDYKRDWRRLDLCASLWSNLDLGATCLASHKARSCRSCPEAKDRSILVFIGRGDFFLVDIYQNVLLRSQLME